MASNNLSYVFNLLKKKLLKLPLRIVALITILSLFGILVLYSAAGASMTPWGYKQLVNFSIFFPMAILLSMINLNFIFRWAFLPYIIVLAMLILVELFGITAMGGKRWIEIAGLRLQPGEPAKIAIVLFLAKYFHSIPPQNVNKFSSLIVPIVATIIPAALIIKQPDLGTGLLTLMVACSIFFAAGIAIWKFCAIGISGIIAIPILWNFLYDYQKKRIMVFLNPELDPLGSGYNIIQSKIAIGSGGIFGKGIAMGTQSHLEFLPEHQTDFIFATLTEDLGFIGGFTLLILYFLLLASSISVAINARNVFSKLLVIGISAIFFFHTFINISMVMGLVPVVGIPLPFISYGGTMMASMLCGFGLVMNVHMNQNKLWK
ncbi:MAG: rod shape-determining protein RodA [Rickettsiaceae bacterium]|nr:rod shape-determining protein RodA [Rickettsiaceae bacterium]